MLYCCCCSPQQSTCATSTRQVSSLQLQLGQLGFQESLRALPKLRSPRHGRNLQKTIEHFSTLGREQKNHKITKLQLERGCCLLLSNQRLQLAHVATRNLIGTALVLQFCSCCYYELSYAEHVYPRSLTAFRCCCRSRRSKMFWATKHKKSKKATPLGIETRH